MKKKIFDNFYNLSDKNQIRYKNSIINKIFFIQFRIVLKNLFKIVLQYISVFLNFIKKFFDSYLMLYLKSTKNLYFQKS